MEGKTKFLLQNSSEMLAADFEMIKIFTLWQNDFVSFLHGDWAVAWNIHHLSPVALLQCSDPFGRSPCRIHLLFLPFFFLWFLSLPILARRVWIERLHDLFSCGAVQQYWGVTFILPAFQSPDWRVGCPFLTALISSDMDGRSRYVAFICHFLSASWLDLCGCCAPS